MENPIFLPPQPEQGLADFYYLNRVLKGTQTPDDLAQDLARSFYDVKAGNKLVPPMAKITVQDKRFRTETILNGILNVLKTKRKYPNLADGQHTVQIVNGRLFTQAVENEREVELRIVGIGIEDEEGRGNYETGVTIKKPFSDWGDNKKIPVGLIFFNRKTRADSLDFSRTVTTQVHPEKMGPYSIRLANQLFGIYKEACTIESKNNPQPIFPYFSD